MNDHPQEPAATSHQAAAPSTAPVPETRYRALRTVSTIYKVIAWAIAIVGTIVVVVSAIAAGSSDDGGAGDAIVILLGGAVGVALYALFAFAIAEMIRLAIAVEENTRRTADAITRNT